MTISAGVSGEEFGGVRGSVVPTVGSGDVAAVDDAGAGGKSLAGGGVNGFGDEFVSCLRNSDLVS